MAGEPGPTVAEPGNSSIFVSGGLPPSLAPSTGPLGPRPARCAFVLGTPGSASTLLADGINQLPNYFIRSDPQGAAWDLYFAWRMLTSAHGDPPRALGAPGRSKSAATGAATSTGAKQPAAVALGPGGGDRLGLHSAGQPHERPAAGRTLPWLGELRPQGLVAASQLLYALTYGHTGQDAVSGFRDVRFVRGGAFPSSGPGSTYDDFRAFLRFLSAMCLQTKLLLITRRSTGLEVLYHRRRLRGVGVRALAEAFLPDLAVTHEWYDRYALEHPWAALRVHTEDMTDPHASGPLAQRLVGFLGEDPATARIAFRGGPAARQAERQRLQQAQPRGGGAGLGRAGGGAVGPWTQEPEGWVGELR
ncbi:hypothetical protein HYH03_015769 [Edaphochlamys debaryana]|uniref:Uncharacterized protein n=1 Tax=Edaphochlamys debaryana TaxID=47281 RepID=A0A835XNN0_9CHLO|nr:hypothetical protein HYH03_015769 [Edaphochlamys debaryana]|eukprot:KAG2485496.1 hypothetical protein HYH03_015769 [Edaphochlamys debaryana]